jgi:predicted metal-dependent RNase
MKFRSLMRHREIGANSYLLESGDYRVVLDSGMHPKYEGKEAMPNMESVPTGSVDAILLSHAHHDHIGSIPLVQRRNPTTPVYMTEPTGEIGSAMLHNSVNVMSKQREELGLMDYPLFTHKELDLCRKLWSYVGLERAFYLPQSDLAVTYHDAGHIIGSAGIQVRQGGKTLFYTGDVNFESQTLSCAAKFPTDKVDVLIMETTRGDYVRPEGYTRRTEKERMAALIRDTYEANGSVLLPVFALGKSQEVMLMLHELSENELIPDMPLILGGLATKITTLHDMYAHNTRRHYPGFSLLEDIDILVASRAKRKQIVYQTRSLFALSSGMMTENTTSNQFAQQGFLSNPKNSVAFVGYTDPESPGYAVRTARPGTAISLDKRLPPVEVNARIESFDFSAHAIREDLLAYAIKVRPEKILLVHGDEPAMRWFERELNAALPDTKVLLPSPGETIDLW